MPTYPLTLYLESDQELGAALLLLDNAIGKLREFSERYPERMDAEIADAMDHAAAARSCLDSDFYSEHNGKEY